MTGSGMVFWTESLSLAQGKLFAIDKHGRSKSGSTKASRIISLPLGAPDHIASCAHAYVHTPFFFSNRNSVVLKMQWQGLGSTKKQNKCRNS